MKFVWSSKSWQGSHSGLPRKQKDCGNGAYAIIEIKLLFETADAVLTEFSDPSKSEYVRGCKEVGGRPMYGGTLKKY